VAALHEDGGSGLGDELAGLESRYVIDLLGGEAPEDV
jgi:hypothetical protein